MKNKINGEFCFVAPFTKEILKKKKLIVKHGKQLFNGDVSFRGVDIDRVCVFSTGESLAILCVQKKGDEKGFYRGGMRFAKCEIDTPKKAIAKFFEYKDVLSQMDSVDIAVRKPLWFDAYCITLHTSKQIGFDDDTESAKRA